jgi:hypothetical protein
MVLRGVLPILTKFILYKIFICTAKIPQQIDNLCQCFFCKKKEMQNASLFLKISIYFI